VHSEIIVRIIYFHLLTFISPPSLESTLSNISCKSESNKPNPQRTNAEEGHRGHPATREHKYVYVDLTAV
jgi:hypothetical protein